MNNISTVKTFQPDQDLFDYPLDIALLQWLVRLLGDIPEQVPTSHIRSHQIVEFVILETLVHFQNVLASWQCDFLQDAKLLKLLIIFDETIVNILFADSLNGYFHAWVFVLARQHHTEATLP